MKFPLVWRRRLEAEQEVNAVLRGEIARLQDRLRHSLRNDTKKDPVTGKFIKGE